MDLKISAEQVEKMECAADEESGAVTGMYVRARDLSGGFSSQDIALLDDISLDTLLESKESPFLRALCKQLIRRIPEWAGS